MISMKELLGGALISEVPIEHQHNLEELQRRMNLIREKWGRPMLVTSGYRTMFEHQRIYSTINAKRRRAGQSELKVPLASKHLFGQAVDISDLDGSLHEWCRNNEALLDSVGLWCEEKDDQARVHFQIVPPRSGKRFFKP